MAINKQEEDITKNTFNSESLILELFLLSKNKQEDKVKIQDNFNINNYFKVS